MKFDPYGAYIKCHMNILTFNMYELFTINMLYSLKKNCHIYTPTSSQRPLSSVLKVAGVVDRFDCI